MIAVPVIVSGQACLCAGGGPLSYITLTYSRLRIYKKKTISTSVQPFLISFSFSHLNLHHIHIDQEESQSTPALLTTTSPTVCNSAVSLGMIPEHSLLESCARLSVSLEGPGLFTISNHSRSSSSRSSQSSRSQQHNMTMDELRAVNRYAESTKSLSYLPQVRDYYLSTAHFSI